MDRIDVVGTGSVQVQPDLFRAEVGAEATGPDVAGVLEQAELASRAMAEAARTRGGATDADLRTTEMSVTPHHDHQGQPAGYRAWLGLSLTLRDLDAAGTVLAEVLAAGGEAARLQGVSLALSDPAAALEAAREAAMADARHQAEQLAGLAGRPLGGVRRVTVLPTYGDPRPMMLQSHRLSMSIPVEGGTASVSASVQVRFELA